MKLWRPGEMRARRGSNKDIDATRRGEVVTRKKVQTRPPRRPVIPRVAPRSISFLVEAIMRLQGVESLCPGERDVHAAPLLARRPQTAASGTPPDRTDRRSPESRSRAPRAATMGPPTVHLSRCSHLVMKVPSLRLIFPMKRGGLGMKMIDVGTIQGCVGVIVEVKSQKIC